MQKIIDEISLHLNDELKRIEDEEKDQTVKTEQSIYCISQCLNQLKEYICNNPFQTKEEEIHFFKYTKPSIYSKLIYFVEIFKIESRCPSSNKGSKKKYLLKVQKRLQHFIDDNIDFYTYYRGHSCYLDEKYFLRAHPDFRLNIDDFAFDMDPTFSTSHDYKIARILAIERLNIYINNELDKTTKVNETALAYFSKRKPVWTDSKIAMIELIYALHASGCIDNGTGDIKEIAKLFETFFDLKLDDIYRSFIEIKTRDNPLKFLEKLSKALQHKIDNQMK